MQTTHFTDASLNIVKTHQSNFRTHASTPCSDLLSNSNKSSVLEIQKKGKSSLKGCALLKTFLTKLAKCTVAGFKWCRGTVAGGHQSEIPGKLLKEWRQIQRWERKSVEGCWRIAPWEQGMAWTWAIQNSPRAKCAPCPLMCTPTKSREHSLPTVLHPWGYCRYSIQEMRPENFSAGGLDAHVY